MANKPEDRLIKNYKKYGYKPEDRLRPKNLRKEDNKAVNNAKLLYVTNTGNNLNNPNTSIRW